MSKRCLLIVLVILILLAFEACKSKEENTETTFESIPGVMLVPDDWWDEEKNENQLENAENSETIPKEPEDSNESTAISVDEENSATQDAKDEATTPAPPADQMTDYEWYNSISGDEQMAFMETFDSIEAFFDWYNNAKAEYAQKNPSVDIGNGVIDLEDLLGGNG